MFGSPTIGDGEIEEVVDSMRSGWIGSGPKVKHFEQMLADYVGVPHIRCVSSCSAALMLAMRQLDIGPGDEVIVPTMTFVACANAVEALGGTPVLIDCEPGTGLVDLEQLEAAIGPRTKAAMVVHLAGYSLDMDRVNSIRDRHGIPIIEDAAHAIGSEWKGRRIGGHGNLTAYSFYVTKNITTIEGGALATDNPEIAERVERLALHGLSVGAWQRFSDSGFKHYEVLEPGTKANMTDVQAAVGIRQLPRLDAWVDRRAELWARYQRELGGLPLALPPPAGDSMRHARHLYRVEVLPESPLGRETLLEPLTDQKIGVGVHYLAVHLHRYYRDRYELEPSMLPVATEMSARTLSLPLSPKVSDDDQTDVIGALHYLLG